MTRSQHATELPLPVPSVWVPLRRPSPAARRAHQRAVALDRRVPGFVVVGEVAEAVPFFTFLISAFTASGGPLLTRLFPVGVKASSSSGRQASSVRASRSSSGTSERAQRSRMRQSRWRASARS